MPLVGGSTSRERALVAFAALLALGIGGCAQRRTERVATTAVVTVPSATAKRAADAPAGPALVPAPAGSRQAAATAAPASAAPATAPAASAAPAAQILSVNTSPSVVHAGENVSWDVRTTTDIVAVTAHVSAYTIPLQRTAPGRFALNFTVPSNVPAFFHGTYNLDVTGESSGGATAKRTVSMTFQ
jgi:hypothetical protein